MSNSTIATDPLTDFLVQYVSYCAMVEVTKKDLVPDAMRNAIDMATIALDNVWEAYRLCKEANVPLETSRSRMTSTVPEYANMALV